jgi:hypothetical protein
MLDISPKGDSVKKGIFAIAQKRVGRTKGEENKALLRACVAALWVTLPLQITNAPLFR